MVAVVVVVVVAVAAAARLSVLPPQPQPPASSDEASAASDAESAHCCVSVSAAARRSAATKSIARSPALREVCAVTRALAHVTPALHINFLRPTIADAMTALLLTASLSLPEHNPNIRDLHRDYSVVFPTGNRNAASHLWVRHILKPPLPAEKVTSCSAASAPVRRATVTRRPAPPSRASTRAAAPQSRARPSGRPTTTATG